MNMVRKTKKYIRNNLILEAGGTLLTALVTALVINHYIHKDQEPYIITGIPQTTVTNQHAGTNSTMIKETCGTLTIAESERAPLYVHDLELLIRQAINNEENITLHGKKCKRTDEFTYAVIETTQHILDLNRYTSLTNNDGSRIINKQELYQKRPDLFNKR